MGRALVLSILFVALINDPAAGGNSYAWDDSTCFTGGPWTAVLCWGGSGYPNGTDDSAYIQLDEDGSVTIPTSSIFNVKVNSLTLTEKVSLSVSPNMFLVMTESSSGTDPTLQIDKYLAVDSKDFGSSVLQAGTPADPEATCDLTIFGSGEIRLGSNAALASATRAKMSVQGGIEVVTSAVVGQPAKISGEVHVIGGEIRVLGGPLRITGEVELSGGAFAEVFDQFQTGLSEILLSGALRGGKLYPGLGVVRMNGGTLGDIEVQPGPVVVDGSLSYFAGEVVLSEGTEVTVSPGRTLEIGGDTVSGAPLLYNDGVILVGHPTDGAAYLRNDGSLVDLKGGGRIVLEHIGSQLANPGSGIFRNGPSHTIEGRGYIQAPVQNQGLFVADGGRMLLFASVTGPTGDAVVQGTASEPGELELRAAFSARNLRIAPHGTLDVQGGRSVVLHGHWIVETQNEAALDWNGSGNLVFSGAGPLQGFETTSEDLGAVNAGFSGNFAIHRVIVGQTGTNVVLRDLHDNGNRTSGPEAVYASTLEVQPGATLNLNGYCFYTKLGGVAHRVQAGEGALFGGGTIIDDGSVVTATGPSAPEGLDLVHVVPNPFNPQTTIRFQLDEFSEGRVSIHDLRGRLVRELAQGPWPRGEQELVWDGRDDAGRALASGVYAVRIEAGGSVRVQRATLLK